MKTLLTFFIFVVFFLCNALAQEKNKAWDYPVKPGSEEWRKFTTSQEMHEACQIPDVILKSLTTAALAEICLKYPLFFEYTAFNDEREGIRIMIERFNGLTELSRRSDGALALVSLYKEMPIITQLQDEKSPHYDTPYKMPFLELLLSNTVFFNQLELKEQAALKQIMQSKYEGKVEHLDVYSLYNIKKTMLLGALILDKQAEVLKKNGERDVIKNFIVNFNNASPELLQNVSKLIIAE